MFWFVVSFVVVNTTEDDDPNWLARLHGLKSVYIYMLYNIIYYIYMILYIYVHTYHD